MPVVVVVHRLKNFDEWLKLFKADPPPKVGRWRVARGSEDRNRVHVVAELTASEVKDVKDFMQSKHMQDDAGNSPDRITSTILLDELSPGRSPVRPGFFIDCRYAFGLNGRA